MKVYLIGNTVFYPSNSNKFIKGSVSGILFTDTSYTLAEVESSAKESSYPLTSHNNLMELVDCWRKGNH